MKKIDPALHERLTTLITAMGYELVGGEWLAQGGKTLFRLYIDKINGVNLDDCAAISRQVSALMDVEEPLRGNYLLEVSSPGINRPLFELEHFSRFIGKRVKIKLYAPLQQRRHFEGVLLRIEDEKIYLHLEDAPEEVVLSFNAIEKANLIGDIHF